MFQLNGVTLQPGRAFVHDGMQYPSTWLRLTTLAEKEAIGIVEVPNPINNNFDGRFYTSADNPKDLDELKAYWTARVKEKAGLLLSDTDWYVVRQAENSAAVPADVLSRRAEIRTMSGQKETAIAGCADVATLAGTIDSSDFNSWDPVPAPTPTPSEE